MVQIGDLSIKLFIYTQRAKRVYLLVVYTFLQRQK